MRTAICTRCRAAKPLGEFGAAKERPSGHRPRCKACEAELARARRGSARGSAPGLVLVLPPPAPPSGPPASPGPPADPPGDGPRLGPYATELERTLATLDLKDGDAAAASVARGLARAMDGAYGDARELAVLSPRYLASLKALRATRESALDTAPTKPARADAASF